MKQQQLFENVNKTVHKIGVNWINCYGRFDDKPYPYYQLALADDYYQGENRKTVNRLRKMIRQYVQEQEAYGRVFEDYRITTSYWLLHKDILELIAPWLDKPLPELFAEAEVDRERWVRIREEAKARTRKWMDAYHLFAVRRSYEVDNALIVFGLNRSATDEDVKKQYRKLAMKHHPDAGGNANEFKRIHDAYEVLQNWNRGIAV